MISTERAIINAAFEHAAMIADAEAAEYQRRIDEHNAAGRHKNDAYAEVGWQNHAHRSTAQNIAALIRLQKEQP